MPTSFGLSLLLCCSWITLSRPAYAIPYHYQKAKQPGIDGSVRPVTCQCEQHAVCGTGDHAANESIKLEWDEAPRPRACGIRRKAELLHRRCLLSKPGRVIHRDGPRCGTDRVLARWVVLTETMPSFGSHNVWLAGCREEFSCSIQGYLGRVILKYLATTVLNVLLIVEPLLNVAWSRHDVRR